MKRNNNNLMDNLDDEAGIPLALLPRDDYPVSFNPDGTVLSVFGELIWNVTPYENFERTRYLRFPFWNKKRISPQMERLNLEARWFLHQIVEDSKPFTLNVASLHNHMSGLNAMAKFSHKQGISMVRLVSEWHWLKKFIGTELSANTIGLLSSLLAVARRIGADKLGFTPVGAVGREALKEELARFDETTLQHPPVPYRVLSILIDNLTRRIEDFDAVSDRYLVLVSECNKDYVTGRSLSGQEKNIAKGRAPSGAKGESMDSLLARLDLRDYFDKNGIRRDILGMTWWLQAMQVAIKYLVHIYSGMRDVEVSSLPLNCLQTVTFARKRHFLIVGDTTKFSKDGPERGRWVTSEEGHRAIECAQRISRCIYSEVCGVDFEERLRNERKYLFVSPSYLKCSSGQPAKGRVPTFACKMARRARLKDMLPKITEADLVELERVDKERAWRQEDKFMVGKPWPLTTHQCRRSLAIYAHRSGLVTLPSLRRQLKHITAAMSLYYATGSAFATDFIGKDRRHFGADWRRGEPVSAFLSYEKNVLDSAQGLFGGHVYWLKQRHTDAHGTIALDRGETERRFKKGELAYRETVLGGCTSTSQCGHASIEIFSQACLDGCAHLAGNVEKLRALTNAQSQFVDRLIPGTVDHTTEARELASLKQALEKAEAQ